MTFVRILTNSLIFIPFICLTQSLICPNRKTECREDMTCCEVSSGKYGCCPLPSAHCCADGLHCCPNGTQCHSKEGLCHPINYEKKLIQLELSSSELCPDKNHTCPRFETCCKERSGSYGCCPYNLAVCCEDLLHCCPHGTTCDVIHKQCVHQSNQIQFKPYFDLRTKIRLIGFEAKNISDIVCPGGRYDCPDGNTCCQISESQWGCCPLENAVCCADRAHCCPNGYKCSQRGCQSL